MNRQLYPEEYESRIRTWLIQRYGNKEGCDILAKTLKKYDHFCRESPDFGGKKNGHARAIYGGLLVFALYDCLPDQPDIRELQDFVCHLFMEPFVKLGSFFDLNRTADMRMIDIVFHMSGKQAEKDLKKWPCGFAHHSLRYDSERKLSRYYFSQCPNAEFARTHGLLHVLPLLCNCDYFGISQIHGQLIRCHTCGTSSTCDYLICGSRNPITQEYETVTDSSGLLISRKKTAAASSVSEQQL